MYWYIIFILAQSSPCAINVTPPSADSAQPGYGWWLTRKCEWEQRPCPASLASDAFVQRLPLGCPAVYPTIAYTAGADLKIRKDFAEANVKIKSLRSELERSRETLTKLNLDSVALVEKSDIALSTCIDTAQLQTRALKQAESQLFWSRLTVATSIAVVLSLGTYTWVTAD